MLDDLGNARRHIGATECHGASGRENNECENEEHLHVLTRFPQLTHRFVLRSPGAPTACAVQGAFHIDQSPKGLRAVAALPMKTRLWYSQRFI